jgi:hypothetical protein
VFFDKNSYNYKYQRNGLWNLLTLRLIRRKPGGKVRNINLYMRNRIVFMLVAACMITGSCNSAKKSRFSDNFPALTGPNIYIYKTRGDYYTQVPIGLSADKKTIVSYPDIKDVFTNGKLAYPTVLEDGFLLDNRGISENVAFLKLTYQQYATLKATPNPDSLFNLILDNDPLTLLYDCGSKNNYQNLPGQLNELIKAKDFSRFKKLK